MQAAGSTLMAAQRQAVQEQHNVVVAFDVAGSRIRIHSDTNNNLLMDGAETVRYEPLGESVRFGRGGALSAGFLPSVRISVMRITENS